MNVVTQVIQNAYQREEADTSRVISRLNITTSSNNNVNNSTSKNNIVRNARSYTDKSASLALR